MLRLLLLPMFSMDVNLATGGPPHRVDVVAQRPECRPDSLTVWNFDARLDTTTSPGPFALGFQPGRSVTCAAVTFMVGLNDQVPVHNACVVGARGVILQFAIDAVAAQVVTPFGRIRRAAVRLVELFIPNELQLGAVLRLNISYKHEKHGSCTNSACSCQKNWSDHNLLNHEPPRRLPGAASIARSGNPNSLEELMR